MDLLKHRSVNKALLLAGGLFIGWAANAQSTDNSMQTDTARRAPMHRPHRGDFKGAPGRGDFKGGPRGDHNTAFRLTPDQHKQMAAINKDFHDKKAALFAKDNITLKEYKSQLIALEKDKKTKMEALWTPDQRQQMEKRKKMRAENEQVMGAARMERLKLHLNLTDDQVAKLKAGQTDLHNQMKAIHENDNLLPEQKMDQLKGLMAKRKDMYRSVLTPEQFTQFEHMSQNHRGFGRHPISI